MFAFNPRTTIALPGLEVTRFDFDKGTAQFDLSIYLFDEADGIEGFIEYDTDLFDPERIERLMISAFLAYIWIVYLGIIADEGGWVYFIHRSDRCDLSLFQLGLRILSRR